MAASAGEVMSIYRALLRYGKSHPSAFKVQDMPQRDA